MTAAPWPRRGVEKPDQFTWLVPSKSHPGDLHTVRWSHDPKQGVFFTCSCPRGRGGRAEMGDPNRGCELPCRHVREVAVAEQEDGYPPRPLAPVGDTRRFTE